MMCKAKGFEIKRKTLLLFLLGGMAVFSQMPALAIQSVTLGWERSADTNVVGYNIYYGTASHAYTNKVSVGKVTKATITNLVDGTTYFFSATTSDNSGGESDLSNEASYVVPLHSPTLNSLSNITINENAPAKTIALKGITSGAVSDVQTLTVTAVSSNPSLIPNPSINYTSPNTTGELTFAPAAYGSGQAVITVTVTDGEITNNIVTKTFTVTVAAVNQSPTLDPISNIAVNENAATQTVALSGISSGAPNENQILKVTAVSSRPALIKNPTVSYTSPNTTGTLNFVPVAKAFGTTIITVTVNDGGKSHNTVKQTFTVTINPVNQPPTMNAISDISITENAPAKNIALSGITSGAANEKQTLTVTAVSSDPSLIPNPIVKYNSAKTTGTLTFQPVTNSIGTAIVTVTVNDGGTSNNIVAKTFTVIVLPNQPPTLNPIGDISVNENAPANTIALSGITSGAASEKQKLTVTAVSSNTSLIPNPIVKYTSPKMTGTLTFKPLAGVIGTSTVTVTVNDGEISNNIVANTFLITVVDTNLTPSIAATTSIKLAPTSTVVTTSPVVVASSATSPDLIVAKTAVEADTYSVIVTNNITGSTTSPTNNLTIDPTSVATLTDMIYENGQYGFNVSGTSGFQYVVQASTNLVDWISVETNTAPFTFVDVNAGQFSQRFYRAIPQQ